VPVIGLYGHTNPWRVGPWRKYQDLWVDRYTDGENYPDPSQFTAKLGRMEEITVEDVVSQIQRAFEKYSTGSGLPDHR
jgi:heptosyltransferase I